MEGRGERRGDTGGNRTKDKITGIYISRFLVVSNDRAEGNYNILDCHTYHDMSDRESHLILQLVSVNRSKHHIVQTPRGDGSGYVLWLIRI